MWTAATAAGRTRLSGWASRRIGSAGWLMYPVARQGWSVVRWTMQFWPGISAAVRITNSDQSIAGSNVMDLIRPRAIVDRTVAPYHIPGSEISSTYWARPVTLARPSLRIGEVPRIGTGSGIVCSGVTGIREG